MEESSGASLITVLSLARVSRVPRVAALAELDLDLTKSVMETPDSTGKPGLVSCGVGWDGEMMSTAGWLMLRLGVSTEMAGWEMTVVGLDTVVTGACIETTGGTAPPDPPPELKIVGRMSSGGRRASVTVTKGSSSSG